MSDRTLRIPETAGNPHRLGRNIRHDPRSLAYPAATAAVHDVDWTHHGGILDQGRLGSCTGNALVNCLMTDPNRRRRLGEWSAVRAYKRATALDPFPGQYPPNDTGSDGLDVCRAGVEFGWLSGYDHAFGLDHALGALMLGPVMVGTNWHQGMFHPDADGTLHPTGAIAGGHEYALVGINGQRVKLLNSWGAWWGLGGYAWLSFADLGALLDAQGDVTVPRSVA